MTARSQCSVLRLRGKLSEINLNCLVIFYFYPNYFSVSSKEAPVLVSQHTFHRPVHILRQHYSLRDKFKSEKGGREFQKRHIWPMLNMNALLVAPVIWYGMCRNEQVVLDGTITIILRIKICQNIKNYNVGKLTPIRLKRLKHVFGLHDRYFFIKLLKEFWLRWRWPEF